jgi:hypothetical protein
MRVRSWVIIEYLLCVRSGGIIEYLLCVRSGGIIEYLLHVRSGGGDNRIPIATSCVSDQGWYYNTYCYINMESSRRRNWNHHVCYEVELLGFREQGTVNELLFAREKFCEVRENSTVANISRRKPVIEYRPILMRNALSRHESYSPWTSLSQRNREIKLPRIKVGLQYVYVKQICKTLISMSSSSLEYIASTCVC